MADFGYDVSDYVGIDPIFGTMADFDALLAAAHLRKLKIILDLVPNHTSDQHAWFTESRSSRRNAKRDWYIWRDPGKDGGTPNNWLSEFGGSAWQYNEATGQYYYHAFLPAQPDLNWRNPEVRAAMYGVMRFWLAKGVDGFRVDVIWHLIKDDQFRDNPPNPHFSEGQPPHHATVPLYSADRDEVHDIIQEMRRVIDEFADRVLIGEIYLPLERLVAYYGSELRGVHLPFNFALLSAPWQARALAKLIDDYEAVLPAGGWPNWVLGNHDRPRVATRVGAAQARNAAMLLLTLRGTPTIYYGDEIGLEQSVIPPAQVRDPFEKNVPGQGLGRDGCRTPMPWHAGPNGGFSTAEPWLPMNKEYLEKNVSMARDDRGSIYHLYRKLIAARRSHRSLAIGCYRPVVASGDLLLFVRELADERMFVALNLGQEPTEVALVHPGRLEGRVLVSSFGDRDGEGVDGGLGLRANEGLLIALSAGARLP
jgi:alpha-glucosidase